MENNYLINITPRSKDIDSFCLINSCKKYNFEKKNGLHFFIDSDFA